MSCTFWKIHNACFVSEVKENNGQNMKVDKRGNKNKTSLIILLHLRYFILFTLFLKRQSRIYIDSLQSFISPTTQTPLSSSHVSTVSFSFFHYNFFIWLFNLIIFLKFKSSFIKFQDSIEKRSVFKTKICLHEKHIYIQL